MKSRHRDPLNPKRFILLKNCNVCLLSGTETLEKRACRASTRAIWSSDPTKAGPETCHGLDQIQPQRRT